MDPLNVSFDGTTTSSDNNSGIEGIAPDRLAAFAALDVLQQLYPPVHGDWSMLMCLLLRYIPLPPPPPPPV